MDRSQAAQLYPGDIQMPLDHDWVPTNSIAQMFIAQSVFTSNIVTIPIVAPAK